MVLLPLLRSEETLGFQLLIWLMVGFEAEMEFGASQMLGENE